MPKFFTDNVYKDKYITITGNDFNHIKNVLRMKENDEITICNTSTQTNYLCKILKINAETIECEIIENVESNSELNINITVFQALPKSEKMELIIQKCTEIGAKEFVPISMERCIVKLDSKSEAKKIERWNKIAEVAAKQSGRDIIPEVKNVINLKKLCNLISKYDIVIVAYENEQNNTLKHELKMLNKDNLNIGIVIGPEGGIEESEIEELKNAGAKIVTLGNRILRTETVAIFLSSIITYEYSNIGG